MNYLPDAKPCKKCGALKPLDMFPKQRRGLYGRASQCASCQNEARRKRHALAPGKHAAYQREYIRRNPDAHTSRKLKAAYGITLADYNRLLAQQQGKCAICGNAHVPGNTARNGKRLHVDHCHESGRVRGLLCSNCNLGIGNLQHDETILLKAIEYLRATQMSS